MALAITDLNSTFFLITEQNPLCVLKSSFWQFRSQYWATPHLTQVFNVDLSLSCRFLQDKQKYSGFKLIVFSLLFGVSKGFFTWHAMPMPEGITETLLPQHAHNFKYTTFIDAWY